DAENVVRNADGFDVIGLFSSGTPVQRIDVLQDREHAVFRTGGANLLGQVMRREMRFTEENKHKRFRMALANLGDLSGGMTISGADLAQVFAGHAVKAIEADGAFPSRGKQFVKRCPVVSSIKIETDALAKFGFFDFAAPPFVDDVLVAGENRFNAKNDRPLPDDWIANQRSQIALRTGQGVIVADQ